MQSPSTANHIYLPIGTRCLRIDKEDNGWVVWIASKDFRFGTYLWLDKDGSVSKVTEREDEGPDWITVRPATHASEASVLIQHNDQTMEEV